MNRRHTRGHDVEKLWNAKIDTQWDYSAYWGDFDLPPPY